MVKIEIDLTKLERGTHIGRVKVTRGGKTFWRKQRVGVKEKSVKTTKPNPEIMKAIKCGHDESFGFGKDGFIKVDVETGNFTWQNRPYTDWSVSGGVEIKPEPVDFRLEGNDIVRLDDDSRITIPEKEIDNTNKAFMHEAPVWITYLDDKWGANLKKGFNEYKEDKDKYNDKLMDIDNYIPEYEDEFEEGTSKYSKKMGLKFCKNAADVASNNFVPNIWYSGNRQYTSLVGEAVQDVISDRYDEDNVVQQQIPLVMKASQKVNESHGEDTIYRGETNVSVSRDMLLQIDEFGDFDLANKLFSCTENEKLAKWYSSVHNQESARGVMSKTHVMLKIPREKFRENVIMDYRVVGVPAVPEQEVTIVGNDISLTGDNVMVNAITPKRKTKKWMTFTQFKSEGGETQNLIDQMVGEK